MSAITPLHQLILDELSKNEPGKYSFFMGLHNRLKSQAISTSNLELALIELQEMGKVDRIPNPLGTDGCGMWRAK